MKKIPSNLHVERNGHVRGIEGSRVSEWPSLEAALNEPGTKVAELEGEGYGFLQWQADGKVVWGRAGYNRLRRWNPATGEVMTDITFDPSVAGSVYYYLISTDGETVFTCAKQIQCWKTPFEKSVGKPISSHDIRVVTLSDDGTHLAHLARQISNEVRIYDLVSGREFPRIPITPSVDLDRPVLQFSHDNRMLLVGTRLWDLSADKELWAWPGDWHFKGFSQIDGELLFPDERHVLVHHRVETQIWDWKKNRKRMTIYELPADHWAIINHETGHWTGTVLAFQYLRLKHTDAEGNVEWLRPTQYEKRTGWKNDPDRVGLSDLGKSPTGK